MKGNCWMMALLESLERSVGVERRRAVDEILEVHTLRTISVMTTIRNFWYLYM
jgi:hypothetical protein